MTSWVFIGLISLITTASIYSITGALDIENQVGPGFELSQSIGPIYIEYGPTLNYKEFLYKTSNNTHFWYTGVHWDKNMPLDYYSGIIPPSISGWSSISQSKINLLYTGNYMYPLLNEQSLPLAKTFLGNFELQNGESIVSSMATYLKYFDEGVLDVYSFSRNKLIIHNSNDPDVNRLYASFLEWYNTWCTADQFKIFRHFYFPIDRDYPTWINLFNLIYESYPHPSTLLPNENWEEARDYSSFSTIDFFESGNKVNLINADPQLWTDIYSLEQAMFRYYDVSTGTIGFWTPTDLVLNHKMEKIAALLEKKPQEVIAIFSNWLENTGTYNPLYFNYIGKESFDWANDPSYDISYVF